MEYNPCKPFDIFNVFFRALEITFFNTWCPQKGHTYLKNLQLKAAALFSMHDLSLDTRC